MLYTNFAIYIFYMWNVAVRHSWSICLSHISSIFLLLCLSPFHRLHFIHIKYASDLKNKWIHIINVHVCGKDVRYVYMYGCIIYKWLFWWINKRSSHTHTFMKVVVENKNGHGNETKTKVAYAVQPRLQVLNEHRMLKMFFFLPPEIRGSIRRILYIRNVFTFIQTQTHYSHILRIRYIIMQYVRVSNQAMSIFSTWLVSDPECGLFSIRRTGRCGNLSALQTWEIYRIRTIGERTKWLVCCHCIYNTISQRETHLRI